MDTEDRRFIEELLRNVDAAEKFKRAVDIALSKTSLGNGSRYRCARTLCGMLPEKKRPIAEQAIDELFREHGFRGMHWTGD